jgi:hypothetical protein
MSTRFFGALCAFGFPSLALAQVSGAYATHVVAYNQGTGNGNFTPSNILGGPQGGGFNNGALDVLTLGNGGDVTVGFAVTIVDGPGADLTVSENGFTFGGGTFAEVAAVEVSTDGQQFARFPSRYSGPVGPLPPFGTMPMGSFRGLTGGLPGLANVLTNTISPWDPSVSGGEAFDLADLANHPLVQSGVVDLQNIQFVRIADVVEGVELDSFGNLIWDNGGTSSADIDAVAVIHHSANQDPNAPQVDFWTDSQGFVHLELEDAQGLGDLDLATASFTIDLAPLPFVQLRRLFRTVGGSSTSVHMVSRAPIWGSGQRHAVGLSIRDHAGSRGADQAMFQD